MRPGLWFEALAGHGGADVGDDVARRCGHSEEVGGSAADLLCVVPGADDLDEELAQPLIGPAGSPLPFSGGVGFVDEAGPAASGALRLRLHDQSGGEQLGDVLTDRVVVERELLVELRDADRVAGLGDVAVDGMARRVAECPSLLLQRGAGHGYLDRPMGPVAKCAAVTPGHRPISGSVVG